MSEPKPILVPGNPGDLELIFETGHGALQKIKHAKVSEIEEEAAIWRIAEATHAALEMWLGRTEIPKR